jgi:CubicO group peptidase (beta-lactamase class C family)
VEGGTEAGVTVRHLLTMTSGLPANPVNSVGAVGDKNAFVVGLPLAARPGERWAYSNEGCAAPLADPGARCGDAAARVRAHAAVRAARMRDTELRLDRAGHSWTYADAKTTLRDFAKVCQLALDGGRFQGTQVVPEAWMRTVTQPIPQNPGYGMPGGWSATRWCTPRAATSTPTATPCPGWALVVARMQSSRRKRRQPLLRHGSELSPDIEGALPPNRAPEVTNVHRPIGCSTRA